MNRYIKLKKRYPAEKYTTIADIKLFIRKASEEARRNAPTPDIPNLQTTSLWYL